MTTTTTTTTVTTILLTLTFFLLNHHHTPFPTTPRRHLTTTPTTTCTTTSTTLINYTCTFHQNPYLKIPFLTLTLILQFYILVITAQNQFSKIVTTLSRHLNLTPSIGAVTLLALGNGAPDVFASLAAVGGGDGRMGFGAILSAGMFVSAVVVGFVAIYSAPFGVDAVSFVRDVLFYMTACLFLFYVYLSGEIWLWQAVGFVGFYLFFVGFVFWMDLGFGSGGKLKRGRSDVVSGDGDGGGYDLEDRKGFMRIDMENESDLSGFNEKKATVSGFRKAFEKRRIKYQHMIVEGFSTPAQEPITYISSKMDPQGHGQPQGSNIMTNVPQLPYATNPYDQTQISSTPGRGPIGPPGGAALQAATQPTAAQLAQQQLAYHQIQQQQQQQLQQQLQSFWANQYREIENVNDFKNHSLPLARIKKIMKADEDVRMISAEAPIVFARACEMFILELTLRSWNHTEENKRRTLQKNDIAAAITRTEIFDFLVDIVPREDIKEEVLTSMPTVNVPVGGPSDTFPYYYMAPQHSPQSGAPGMISNKPMMDPGLYAQQPPPYMGPAMWPQPPQQPHSPSDS